MSFPAIQCGSIQHFDLYRPCSFRSKVKGHFDILHCVLLRMMVVLQWTGVPGLNCTSEEKRDWNKERVCPEARGINRSRW
jgi:hypothetical protein